MHARRTLTALTMIVLAVPAALGAQSGGVVVAQKGPSVAFSASKVDVIESVAVAEISPVRDAPFSAEAVTEFTQTLGDGNRIERRYAASVARDSRGRTRRQQEIALVGPLASNGPAPKLVAIHDPETGTNYTLDENLRVAYRNQFFEDKVAGLRFNGARPADVEAFKRRAMATASPEKGIPIGRPVLVDAAPLAKAGLDMVGGAAKIVSESLGTRTIEGVQAEGTRTTSTIPAGAIGNVMPIEVVSERWFSRELQEAVLISRRDPRSGETTYRLTNIIRAEPPPDLFVVPSGYDVRDGGMGQFRVLRKIEEAGKVR